MSLRQTSNDEKDFQVYQHLAEIFRRSSIILILKRFNSQIKLNGYRKESIEDKMKNLFVLLYSDINLLEI